ncbi:hypothetical protein Slin15195_G082550 [Septoria linicola]|uniref:Uncharacterized protein n=1 Tax=Septoria linicola TaxID=215465 RepID=A0A9Q9B074_9PEZI|nr:hypothetical protein Slin15195_G082550 [Septoria linicola]
MPHTTPMCWFGACSEGVAITPTGNYTRCIQTGSGWDHGFAPARFQIVGYWRTEDRRSPNITFLVHSSPKAAFLPDGKIPANLKEAGFDEKCFTEPPPPSCDWTAFFEMNLHGELSSRSRNITTWELVQDPQDFNTAHPNMSAIAIDFAVYQAFANYTLDTSLITNPLSVIDLDLNFTRGMTLLDLDTIAIDPAWTLAAWSAGHDARVSGTRASSTGLHSIFDALWDQDNYQSTKPLPRMVNRYYLNAYAFMPVIQMLSLIDYNTTGVTSDTKPSRGHPVLHRDARMYVWAYGLQSRTSYVGAIVTGIGCLVVIAEVFIGLFIDRRRFRSPTQLLVAALEHQYANEFDGNSQGMANLCSVCAQYPPCESTVS